MRESASAMRGAAAVWRTAGYMAAATVRGAATAVVRVRRECGCADQKRGRESCKP